jgi:hypothetical protein
MGWLIGRVSCSPCSALPGVGKSRLVAEVLETIEGAATSRPAAACLTATG